MIQIELKSDHSELVPNNFQYFPVHARTCRLSGYPGLGFVSHWHDDFEFVVILRGRMLFSVNGEKRILGGGRGIFVNSRQMHQGSSIEGEDCEFLCIVFPPSLLYATPRMREAYVQPMSDNPSFPSIELDPSGRWGCEMIETLKGLYAQCEDAGDGFDLGVMSAVFALGFSLFRQMENQCIGQTAPAGKHLNLLREMLGFVQKNYRDRIALGDIAAAGNVCRSSCCDIFRQILHVSPIAYLTDYRIEKSMELLNDPNVPVTEIALQCGFGSPSYFSEVFRAKMGRTPSEYRNSGIPLRLRNHPESLSEIHCAPQA